MTRREELNKIRQREIERFSIKNIFYCIVIIPVVMVVVVKEKLSDFLLKIYFIVL
jgi:hypothetical protein